MLLDISFGAGTKNSYLQVSYVVFKVCLLHVVIVHDSLIVIFGQQLFHFLVKKSLPSDCFFVLFLVTQVAYVNAIQKIVIIKKDIF